MAFSAVNDLPDSLYRPTWLVMQLGALGRVLTVIAIPVVGLTRIYAGAHLPLDIAGGAALGLAVDAAVALGGKPRPTVAQAQGPAMTGRAPLPIIPGPAQP
jgi:hypothetical protein